MTEPKPSIVGNQADEQGAFNKGADFDAVNTSPMPRPAVELEVAVVSEGKNLVITPIERAIQMQRRGFAAIQESPRHLLDAQLFDDPNMVEAQRAQQSLIARKSERGQLIFYAIRGSALAAAIGDRLIVKRDTMESAYSCRTCKGKGHSEVQCPTCKGAKEENINGTAYPCRSCIVLGYSREGSSPCGFVKCEACQGAGWAGGVVIPEVAQSEPISGVVVSSGPQCVNFFPGDRVLHSRYSGHTSVTPEGDAFTTMHEHEVLWLLRELQ